MVVDVPLAWAATHGHPRWAVGFGARTAPWRLDALATTPLYRDLLTLQDPAPALAAPAPDPAKGRCSALDLGARYVVVGGAYPGVDDYLAKVGLRARRARRRRGAARPAAGRAGGRGPKPTVTWSTPSGTQR